MDYRKQFNELTQKMESELKNFILENGDKGDGHFYEIYVEEYDHLELSNDEVWACSYQNYKFRELDMDQQVMIYNEVFNL